MYVIFDKLDNVVHRGPMTQTECVVWLMRARRVFPRPAGVDEVWEIRRLGALGWLARKTRPLMRRS